MVDFVLIIELYCKKQYDKREALKEKDDKRDMARAFKR